MVRSTQTYLQMMDLTCFIHLWERLGDRKGRVSNKATSIYIVPFPKWCVMDHPRPRVQRPANLSAHSTPKAIPIQPRDATVASNCRFPPADIRSKQPEQDDRRNPKTQATRDHSLQGSSNDLPAVRLGARFDEAGSSHIGPGN